MSQRSAQDEAKYNHPVVYVALFLLLAVGAIALIRDGMDGSALVLVVGIAALVHVLLLMVAMRFPMGPEARRHLYLEGDLDPAFLRDPRAMCPETVADRVRGILLVSEAFGAHAPWVLREGRKSLVVVASPSTLLCMSPPSFHWYLYALPTQRLDMSSARRLDTALIAPIALDSSQNVFWALVQLNARLAWNPIAWARGIGTVLPSIVPRVPRLDPAWSAVLEQREEAAEQESDRTRERGFALARAAVDGTDLLALLRSLDDMPTPRAELPEGARELQVQEPLWHEKSAMSVLPLVREVLAETSPNPARSRATTLWECLTHPLWGASLSSAEVPEGEGTDWPGNGKVLDAISRTRYGSDVHVNYQHASYGLPRRGFAFARSVHPGWCTTMKKREAIREAVDELPEARRAAVVARLAQLTWVVDAKRDVSGALWQLIPDPGLFSLSGYGRRFALAPFAWAPWMRTLQEDLADFAQLYELPALDPPIDPSRWRGLRVRVVAGHLLTDLEVFGKYLFTLQAQIAGELEAALAHDDAPVVPAPTPRTADPFPERVKTHLALSLLFFALPTGLVTCAPTAGPRDNQIARIRHGSIKNAVHPRIQGRSSCPRAETRCPNGYGRRGPRARLRDTCPLGPQGEEGIRG